jgi:hypothetical protein
MLVLLCICATGESGFGSHDGLHREPELSGVKSRFFHDKTERLKSSVKNLESQKHETGAEDEIRTVKPTRDRRTPKKSAEVNNTEK